MASRDPFALRVEAGLRGRGLTLRGLCRAAGLDASFFSKVLAGKRSPPADESMLRRIAEVLGLDAVELIVSAGRIPAEWSALCDDPELFHEVDACASGRSRRRPGPAGTGGKEFRPAGTGGTSDTAGITRPIEAKPKPQQKPLPEFAPRAPLSEELL